MSEYVEASGLKIARVLDELVREQIAPGTGVEPFPAVSTTSAPGRSCFFHRLWKLVWTTRSSDGPRQTQGDCFRLKTVENGLFWAWEEFP